MYSSREIGHPCNSPSSGGQRRGIRDQEDISLGHLRENPGGAGLGPPPTFCRSRSLRAIAMLRTPGERANSRVENGPADNRLPRRRGLRPAPLPRRRADKKMTGGSRRPASLRIALSRLDPSSPGIITSISRSGLFAQLPRGRARRCSTPAHGILFFNEGAGCRRAGRHWPCAVWSAVVRREAVPVAGLARRLRVCLEGGLVWKPAQRLFPAKDRLWWPARGRLGVRSMRSAAK